MRNVILIGFMGAGKTTVGERYGKKHGLPMVDTDWLIEERAGMTISEIFARKGEEEFRRRDGGPPGARFPIRRKRSFPWRRASSAGRETGSCVKQLGTWFIWR
ncbi:MAG: shikimate kinase [Hungatella hathewayi]|uniref:shikimate kinase n=1 Tax=Hungatella hathewayi TaxID=154046 RepID=UPI003990E4E6